MRTGKAAVLLAGALALSALGLFAGRGALASYDAESEGPQFVYNCSWSGPESGAITCTLKVTGLPDPLDKEVSLSLAPAGAPVQTTSSAAPSATVVSAQMPDALSDAPSLVSLQVGTTPPALVPRSVDVPLQPPKNV